MFFFFVQKRSSLQKAAYFFCQKLKSDPSLKKHKAAKCNAEQAFSQSYLKEIRGTCVSFFELAFQTLPSCHYLTTGGALEKWACELHAVSSSSKLGHLGPGLCWDP